MGEQTRTQRRRLLQEAEGFVELAVLFDDCSPLEQRWKTVLADRCLSTLSEIDESYSHKSIVLYLQGQAHRLAERYEQAILSLQAAWQANPTNFHTGLALGWCFKRTGQLGLAIDALQRALLIDSTIGIIHYNLACYLALLHQSKSAVDHLATALSIDQSFRALIAREPDFDPIRDDPEFQAIATVIV